VAIFLAGGLKEPRELSNWYQTGSWALQNVIALNHFCILLEAKENVKGFWWQKMEFHVRKQLYAARSGSERTVLVRPMIYVACVTLRSRRSVPLWNAFTGVRRFRQVLRGTDREIHLKLPFGIGMAFGE
jgi:hypothetical protein